MPRRSVTLRLDDMIEAATRVREVPDDLSIEGLEADWQRHWLIQRGIEILSEASRHLPHDMKERHPDIPRTKVAGIATSSATATRTSLLRSFGSWSAGTCHSLSRRAGLNAPQSSGIHRSVANLDGGRRAMFPLTYSYHPRRWS